MKQTGKRLVRRLLALALTLGLLTAAPSARAEGKSGTCGDGVEWVLDNEGVMTISGSGAMYDYDNESNTHGTHAPWLGFRSDITELVIGPGVTNVGAFAFKDCVYLEKATLSDGVKSIGLYAFDNCERLAVLTLPAGLESVDVGAFLSCEQLKDVYYGGSEADHNTLNIAGNNDRLSPSYCKWHYRYKCGACGKGLTWEFYDGLLRIDGAGAVSDYSHGGAPWNDVRFSIKRAFIGRNVTSIGAAAFHQCDHLTDVYYGGSEADRKELYIISTGSANDSLKKAAWHYDYGNGYCGDKLWWELCDGTLTISGEGAMKDYPNTAYTPWYEHKSAIRRLVVQKDVTSIGSNAFSCCDSLEYVVLPKKIQTVGDRAFGGGSPPHGIVYYGGSEADRNGMTVAASGNDRLQNAEWLYERNGVPGITATIRRTTDGTEVAYAVQGAGKGMLLVIAEYKDGRLDSVSVRDAARYPSGAFRLLEGLDYCIMLIDGETFAPLCPAWSSRP